MTVNNTKGTKKKLTAKQELFCKEYIIDLNASRAARAAGYAGRSAKEVASENLTKGNIQDYIRELKREREEKLKFDAEEVLRRLSLLAQSNVSKFVKKDGQGGFNMYAADDLSEDDMYCIQEITTEEYYEGSGESRKPVKKTKLKLTDKLKAIELAGKHVDVSAFAEKLNAEVKQDLTESSSQDIARNILFALQKAKNDT